MGDENGTGFETRSMEGRLCLVTGATSGIGYEVALGLARRGARVVGVGRSPERSARAAELIRKASGHGEVRFEVADLSSQAAVRELAKTMAGASLPLSLLVNNAGTFAFRRTMTADAVELQFAVNYLAGFLLAALLLPAMAQGARIINVSSGSHYSGRIHWDNLALRPLYNGLAAYSQSKLAGVLFTYELARRLPASRGITVNAADPGLVNTEIGFKGTGPLVRAVWAARARRGVAPREAAGPIVELAATDGRAGRSGLYWRDGHPVASSRRSHDESDAKRLWELSERLCGVTFSGAAL